MATKNPAKKKTSSASRVTKTAVAVGVAGAAAAAIGAYWLYGAQHAAKHRKMAASWMLKARAEVMEAVAKLGQIDKTAYVAIVDEVVNKYAKLHNSTAEIAQMTKEMKAAWSHIHAATKPAKRAVKKLTKRSS